MSKKVLSSIGVVALAWLLGVTAYRFLPTQVAIHWGLAGQVNGYTDRFWGAFLLPIIQLATLLIFIIAPYLDPLRINIKRFQSSYELTILSIEVFLTYVYCLTLFWNLNGHFNMIRWLVPAFSILFFSLGRSLRQAKRNWFFGIRTPWTLSSDLVWDRTHQLGAKLFIASSFISLLGFFWIEKAVWFILIPIISATISLFVYSYLLYRHQAEKV